MVSLIKREMGNRDYNRVFHDRNYSAPAISSLILEALAGDIQRAGFDISSVVITVPAYFGMLEKEATRQAGELAELKVAAIVPEPVAAAFAYGLGEGAADETVLVYDLGGGTFDVTIMRIGKTSIEVLAVGGNHQLGGANWDEVLFNHLLDEAVKEAGDDALRDDEFVTQAAWNDAEKVKKALSSASSRAAIVRHSGGSAKITVTREQFEGLTAHLLEQTVDVMQRTLEEAERLHPGVKDQLSSVLLVGGSSHMPAVRAAVSTALGREAKLADPDLAVAKGAALYAAGLAVRDIILPDHDSTENLPLPVESLTPLQEEKVREVVGGLLPEAALKLAERTVSNVLPKAVGIKLVDMSSPDWEQNPEEHAYVQHLVEAQTPVPHTSPAFKAGTVSANQDVIRIEIWEQAGESAGRDVQENTLLKHGDICDLRPFDLPANSPIDIFFNVNSEGLVQVTALEPTSRKEIKVEAKIQLLTQAQMDEARRNLSGLTART